LRWPPSFVSSHISSTRSSCALNQDHREDAVPLSSLRLPVPAHCWSFRGHHTRWACFCDPTPGEVGRSLSSRHLCYPCQARHCQARHLVKRCALHPSICAASCRRASLC
jgi:hypothetical protein